MSDKDPFQIFSEQMEDLEKHTKQNRTHAETALYTEVLPRTIKILDTIGNLLLQIYEEGPLQPDEPAPQYVEIRYSTATSIENMILQKMTESEELAQELQPLYMMIMNDLHGVSPDQLYGIGQYFPQDPDFKPIDDQPPEPPEPPQPPDEPEDLDPHYDPIEEHGSHEPIPLHERDPITRGR